MAEIQDARMAAAREGATHFTCPKPCKVCDSPDRYVKSNQCVRCSKRRAKAQQKVVRDTLDAVRTLRGE